MPFRHVAQGNAMKPVFTPSIARTTLAATVTRPSAGFWVSKHVGVRIDQDTLCAGETVIVLTGPVASIPSRLLAYKIGISIGCRLVEASAWCDPRDALLPGTGLVAVAYDKPGNRHADSRVAPILVSRKPSAARTVATTLIADSAVAAAIIEAEQREMIYPAVTGLTLAGARRPDEPLEHWLSPTVDRWRQSRRTRALIHTGESSYPNHGNPAEPSSSDVFY